MAFEFPLDADVCFGAFMRCFGAVIQRRVGSMEPRCIASIDRGSSAYQLIGCDMPSAVMLMWTAAKTAVSADGGGSFRDIDVQAGHCCLFPSGGGHR
ncbi:hypothetical protein [Burkholderia gladioli]|uniref:hypothetical protein n=1 Tax=Burkholderia gladioli TaxID=28095 RepID=UPI00164034EF|nr:hypothetical protein [Burkholderia gladioli]